MTHHNLRRAVGVAVASVLVAVMLPGIARAQAPSAPVLVAPASAATTTGTSPTLQVTASDPDGGDLQVTFEGRVKGATVPTGNGEKFSVVVLPDTQNYTYGNRQATITAQSQWVVANRSALNIAFVAQLGDLVSNFDQPAQWVNVSAGLKPLDDAGVPTSVVPGNHDFDNATGAVGLYDTYFPVSRYANASWTPATSRYGGYYGQNQFGPDAADRRNMNNYALFSAGGTDFLMLNLEWEAPQPILAWADRVLAAYPDRVVILTTHSYVSVAGGLRTTAQRPGGTPPATLWSSFVATHCQIKVVLSGHEHNGDLGEARRTDVNSCGQQVQGILTDYQDRANGGNGWLRYYTFDPAAGTMTATTYSPTLGQYETDADSAFTLPFPFATQVPAPFSPIGTATVASGGTASVIWNGLADDTGYEWRAVASDGTTSGPTSDTWTLRTPVRPQSFTDTFRRTVSGGWGTADTGQRWTGSAASSFGVDGEWGTITVPPGTGRSIRPTGVSLGDAVIETDLRIAVTPSGSGTYLWLIGRESGTASYRAKLTFSGSRATTLAMTRNVSGADTVLTSVRLPGTVPAAGTTWRVRFAQSGAAPTTLRASVWPAAGAEPASWMLTATDGTGGLQAPGGFGIDTYVSSTATAAQTVQFDRYAIAPPGGTPPPPPPNAAPTAVIAAPVIDGRTVTLDGGGSTDTDGSVTAWRWAFGDGATADGKTVSHTYDADGTFPITLTVTDDDGATATATTSATVAAPPSAADAARDSFARTVSGAWGSADTGGAWSQQGTASRYSVANGAGRHVLTTAGTSAENSLGAVSVTGSETRLTVAWTRTGAAGTMYTSVIPRAVTSTTDYRVNIVVRSDGRPSLYPVRRIGGVETSLSSITLPMTVTATTGYAVAVRLEPSGAATVISAKLWRSGTTEPPNWQVTATDGAAALQGPGMVKLYTYMSSAATAPVTTSFDDLVVSRL